MKFLKFLQKRRRKNKKLYAWANKGSQVSSNKRREKRHIRIPVAKLEIGMFVSELDKPWDETPFLIQGFYIRNIQDIEEVSNHCDHVTVDTFFYSKSTPAPNGLIHKLPDQQEWGAAQATHTRVQSLTKGILDEIRLGGHIANEKVTEIVDQCIESVLTNTDAVLLINQMALKHSSLERHSVSTCILAVAFGRHLGYPRDSLEKLGSAALLHDVGMLKLPEDLLEKAYSSLVLTDQEAEVLKKHTTYGRDILMANTSLWHAVDIAYTHHENCDGSGFPRGLKEKSIPKFSQVVAITDTYESLTSHWRGSKPISSLDALRAIHKEKNKRFAPELAQGFIQFIHIYPPGAIVQIQSGDIGVIVKRNEINKHFPTVLLLRDENGKPRKPELADLATLYQNSKNKTPPICKMFPSGAFGIDVASLFKKGLIES